MTESNLKTEISLIYFKYKEVKDNNELISLLNEEFGKQYSLDDIINLDISMTENEIANKIINYGYNLEYKEDY